MATVNVVNKVHILEQEVVDLKNQNRSKVSKMGLDAYTGGGEIIGEGVTQRVDMLIEEIN